MKLAIEIHPRKQILTRIAMVITLALLSAVPLFAQEIPPTGGRPGRINHVLRDPTAPSSQLSTMINNGRANGAARVLKVELENKADTNAPVARMIETADFANVTFAEASRLLEEKAGLNIAASTAAGAVRVQTYLKHLTAQDVLETLCTSHGLWFRRDPRSGVFRIFTVAEFRQDLASFREEKTQVFTLLYPNATDIAHALQDLFGNRIIVNFGANDMEMTDDLQRRFDRFDLVDGRSQGFGGLVSGTGGSTVGGSSGSYRGSSGYGSGGYGSRGNSSYGQNAYGRGNPQPTIAPPVGLTADQIQTLQQDATGENPAVPGQPDATDKIVERRVNIYVSVMRHQNKLVVRTADEQSLEEIRSMVTKLDVPTSLVLLEVKVLSILLGDGFNSSFDYTFANGQLAGSLSTGTIAPPPGPGQIPGGTGFQPNNLIFQYLGKNFAARLELLESKNRVTELATPMLLTANNEVSRVFVGEERPLNRGFNAGQVVATGTTTFNTASSTDIQFRPVGTTLLVTPSINADRTVTLRVLQENSQIEPQGGTILIPNGTGFTQQAVDIVQSRTVSGTFVAKDRYAVIVGGLINEGVTNNSTGIPGLSKIPYLGQLFRSDNKARGRSELIVIIKPYILNTPSEAEDISRELAKNLSLHPYAAHLSGNLDAYKTNEVVLPPDSKPFANPK